MKFISFLTILIISISCNMLEMAGIAERSSVDSSFFNSSRGFYFMDGSYQIINKEGEELSLPGSKQIYIRNESQKDIVITDGGLSGAYHVFTYTATATFPTSGSSDECFVGQVVSAYDQCFIQVENTTTWSLGIYEDNLWIDYRYVDDTETHTISTTVASEALEVYIFSTTDWFDFGFVEKSSVFTAATINISVTGIASYTSSFLGGTFENSNFKYADTGSYPGISAGGCGATFTVGTPCDVGIIPNNLGAGFYSGGLRISYNNGFYNDHAYIYTQVAVYDTGNVGVPYSKDASIDFGDVANGESVYKMVEIKNDYDSPVHFSTASIISGTGVFIDWDYCEGRYLASGDSCYVQVYMVGSSQGNLASANLDFYYNDGNNPSQGLSVPLSGNGL